MGAVWDDEKCMANNLIAAEGQHGNAAGNAGELSKLPRGT